MLQLESGVYHGLNPVAGRVWELLETPSTVGQVVDALLEEYDVERERCESDVAALLVALREAGLVELGNGGTT